MNSIIVQMNLRLMQLSSRKNNLLILLGLVMFGCSDEMKQPEEIIQPSAGIIENYDRFDPSLNGFIYADFEQMRNDPAYHEVSAWLGNSKINIGETRIDKYKKLLSDFEINQLDDFNTIQIAVYNSENSTDYAAIIKGSFDNSIVKKKATSAGFKSPVMVNNSIWLFNENNRLFIRFVRTNEIELTTKPELFVNEGSASLKVSRMMKENFPHLAVRNHMLYYFGLPENLSEKVEKFNKEEGFSEKEFSITFDEDAPSYFKGILYFDHGVKSRNILGFNTEKSLLTASGLMKMLLGYITVKTFMNNETSIAEFIDVSKQDSTLQFDLILPDEKISKLYTKEKK